MPAHSGEAHDVALGSRFLYVERVVVARAFQGRGTASLLGGLCLSTPVSISSLHQVAVPATDLARSIAFYRDTLGLPLLARFEPPGLAFFALGETRLLVETRANANSSGGVLYFRVGDIHAAAAALKARGLAFDQEPHAIHRDDAGTFGAAGEEEWMAFFRDPDGNALALAARIAPRRAS